VVAASGTKVLIVVWLMLLIIARAPLNLTTVLPGDGSKPLPWIVTSVPTVPLPGEKAVISGLVSTVKVEEAEAELPARSEIETKTV
jgi:hypothetical protein